MVHIKPSISKHKRHTKCHHTLAPKTRLHHKALPKKCQEQKQCISYNTWILKVRYFNKWVGPDIPNAITFFLHI